MFCPSGYQESFKLIFEDFFNKCVVELYYLIMVDSDCICRNVVITNKGQDSMRINKVASMQLDIEASYDNITSFNGAWGREMHRSDSVLTNGKLSYGSKNGLTSTECNPLFFVRKANTTLQSGQIYGFNLIYSGSHKFSIERSPYESLRIINGISDDNLDYILECDQKFVSPYALMTYSGNGYNGASANMHKAIRNNIMRANPILPVMLNTWEAMYFDINEDKIKLLANKAKDMGFDGLVIDDGWFGKRKDDTTSLGDWTADKTKFPNGINNIANYVKQKGLLFGLWIEPEMINLASELYKSKPDWVVIPKDNILGRNQYYLDLTNNEVIDFVISIFDKVINQYGANYIKWDCNRRFNMTNGIKDNFCYQYAVGLNKVMNTLRSRYPDIIIEGCASGGGRFDLGMLTYCNFVWTSDNTDPLSRIDTQEGVSYGYPINAILNHITVSPNHATKRITPLMTRCDVAGFGVLGAQLDILKCDDKTIKTITDVINKYKQNIKWLGNADFYRLQDGQINNDSVWQIIANDHTQSKILVYRKKFYTGNAKRVIKVVGLQADKLYKVTFGNKTIFQYGLTLMNAGIVLSQNFQGHTLQDETLFLLDNTTLIIDIMLQDNIVE